MTGPSVSEREAALIQRLDATVGGALTRNGVGTHSPAYGREQVHAALRAAVVDAVIAGLEVLKDELGPRTDGAVPDPAPALVRQGVAEGFPLVQGRCPSCGGESLFLGAGGHVTCSRLDCPDPCEVDTVLRAGMAPDREDNDRARLLADGNAVVDMLTEMGADTGEAPRVLPTEPGAVVLVTELVGPVDPPVLAMRDDGGDTWVLARKTYGMVVVAGTDIDGWLPARVVRNDPHGPVAALHDVLRISRDHRHFAGQRMQQVEFAAREALKALGEDVTS